VNLKQSTLATLAYHSIFDYPLTLEEILNYLIGNKSTEAKIKKQLYALIKENKIGDQNGYFYMKKDNRIVEIRLKRQGYSKQKLKKAEFFANVLKFIPTVKLIAITGALSMQNSTKNDDIDLLIVTSKNTIWSTRFLANLLLLPYKRSPNSKNQNNKACLNVFLDESALLIKDQNLYTAHELCQLKLLWDSNNIYNKLIKTNAWVSSFLPNWKPEPQSTLGGTKYKNQKSKNVLLFTYLVSRFENLLKNFQLKYMHSKITTERIGDRQLFFHPKDTQKKVLTTYKRLISRSLDKVYK